jgi:alpha-tubulin suppressor-like RCC1 family protein
VRLPLLVMRGTVLRTASLLAFLCSLTIVTPLGATRFRSLGLGGDHHTCAVSTSGRVFCWGFDFGGTLGTGNPTKAQDACALFIGTAPCSATPLPVMSEEAFSSVTTRDAHSCALAMNNEAYCWGANGSGEVGIGGKGQNVWVPTRVLGGFLFSQLIAGLTFTCGLHGGRAYCWGDNNFGSLGTSVDSSPEPIPVATSLTFSSIAAGAYSVCGIAADQTAHCWGINTNAQLGSPPTDSCDGVPCSRSPVPVSGGLHFTSIGVGQDHACGIATDGFTYCWGENYLGQGGRPDRATVSVPLRVSGNLKFATLTVGGAHNCGLTPDGSAYCWGLNGVGQLGTITTEVCGLNGPYDCATRPALVAGGHQYSVISAGWQHTCAIELDGRLYCWGFNDNGQLGDGTYTNRIEPTLVLDPYPFRRRAVRH